MRLKYSQTGLRFCAALFVCVACAPAIAVEPGVFFQFEADAYSEPEPLESTLGDWGRDFRRGENQWLLSEFQFGYRFTSGLEMSLRQRAYADARLSPDAVAVYGKIERNEPLQQADIPVQIQLNSLSARGLRVGYGYRTTHWWVNFGVSAYQSKHLMDGGLEGVMQVDDSGGYELAAAADYHYYKDVLFKRPDVRAPQGYGAALDLSVGWLVNDRWQIDASADDLFARFRWESAPYSRINANSNRETYTSEGFMRLRPLFSGVEGYSARHEQTLDARYQLSAQRQHAGWTYRLTGYNRFGRTDAEPEIARSFGGRTRVSVAYALGRQHIKFGLEQGAWSYSFGLDALKSSRASSAFLSIRYR